MDHNQDWKRIAQFIENRNDFILTTHVSPDGDALGSEMALSLALEEMGKRCRILNSSPTSVNYQFLDPEGKISKYKADRHLEELSNADGIFILDISDWARLREIGKAIRQLDLPRVCIDHHHPTDKISEIELIDPLVSCTGELLYEFFAYLQVPLSKAIAEALYTCLLTDTGSFRFSNTSPAVHHITAELLEKEVDSRKIYEHVYESCSPAKVSLMGDMLTSLQYECEGKVAWFEVTRQKLRESGAQTWELETFPEIPKMIAGVEIGLMFTEMDRNRTKISLRSKGRIPIIDIAENFGGGGHKFGAGAVLSGSLDRVRENVIEETKKIVSRFSAQ